MCGLFGFSSYDNTPKNDSLSDIVNILAKSSTVRGTDATGIAYILDRKIEIEKEAKSAYKIDFSVPDGTRALIGHTRHSTQGSEKKNFNNHPFKGKNQFSTFALAHNGVLSNDKQLRHKLNLPQSKIETDSYIAVQLLEKKNNLNMESMKYMAEQIEGSFTFSVIDDKNNIYIVKGDSPISILHFKDLKLYVYASTDRILWDALINSPLFEKFKFGLHYSNNIEEIKVKDGQILKISNNGKLQYDSFDYNPYSGFSCDWWLFGRSSQILTSNDEYLEGLKIAAANLGYDGKQLDELLESGFTLLDIEEMIYSPDTFEYELGLLEECEV